MILTVRLPIVAACLLLLVSTTGCIKVPEEPVVHITTTLLPAAVEKLPSPVQLTSDEVKTSWGEEYFLGTQFAKCGDYYRATTCFHRSLFLLPSGSPHYSEVFHALILTYSLAGKYDQVCSSYERYLDKIVVRDQYLAIDCIMLIYEAYSHQNRQNEASSLLETLPKTETTFQTLSLYQTLMRNSEDCFSEALKISSGLTANQKEELSHLVALYRDSKKHPETAASLNALLPGAGYVYVREYQTAATAFLLNGLFMAATWQFFSLHQPAAALIAGGFEVGWYAGGIVGAHLAATTYNERLREQLLKNYLLKYKLFPLNQLHYQW